MKQKVLIVVAILPSVWNAYSQGVFQDLDFEEATIVRVQTGYSAAAAFPGWQTFIGTTPTSVVAYDGESLQGAQISLFDENPSVGTAPLQGNYSVVLFGGGAAPNLFSTSISQTGTIPAGTESIEFDGNVSGAPFVVTFNGTPVEMTPLQSFVNYELWGGDIPAGMAGQSETLTITEQPPSTGIQPGRLELDDIVFSPTAVTPEPSPFVLTAIGGILFALYRRFLGKRA